MLTRNEFHVLLVQGSRHGYGIMQDVETLTDGELRVGPSTLYTAIKRLVNAGLIEECEPDADRRRCYRVTRKGRGAATAEAEQLSAIVRAARKRGLLASES
jgi:DNA-binding PadR family transcriptional regulator